MCSVMVVQATGPFLHIGALAAVTALSWLVAGQVARAEKTRKCPFYSALSPSPPAHRSSATLTVRQSALLMSVYLCPSVRLSLCPTPSQRSSSYKQQWKNTQEGFN